MATATKKTDTKKPAATKAAAAPAKKTATKAAAKPAAKKATTAAKPAAAKKTTTAAKPAKRREKAAEPDVISDAMSELMVLHGLRTGDGPSGHVIDKPNLGH